MANTYHSFALGQHSYGHKPPQANHLLLLTSPFSHEKLAAVALPDVVDLRAQLLSIRNQEDVGECSGFSTAGFREHLHFKATGQLLPSYLSPAYLYCKTRQAEGTFPQDAGASIVDEFSSLQSFGVCPESFLPFNNTANQLATPACDTAAAQFRIGQPLQIDWSNMSNVETVLASGLSMTIGFTVYQSFESTGSDGMIPAIPANDPILGGHGVQVVGYQHTAGLVTIRNQWSSEWGDMGYCYMPYAYFQQVVSEAWTAAAVA